MNRPQLSAILASLFLLAAFSGCSKSGGGLYSPQIAYELLDSPGAFVESGSAFPSSNTNYIFADKNGDITAASNRITVTNTDPATPLAQLDPNAVFADEIDSGGCTLGGISTTATDSTDSTLYTSIVASNCEDQSVIELDYNTYELGDAAGNSGDTTVSQNFTVDNAPVSTGAPLACTDADGENCTTSSDYNTSTDNSVVMTFSKSLSGGNLTPTVSGCGVTITSATLVNGGKTIVWTLDNLPSGSATCTFDISGITDFAGNADDPTDTNIDATLSFN